MRMLDRQSKAEAIIHPVRLRIFQILRGRSMKPKEIAAAMPDVPQASLYRHLKLLHEHDILEVAEQRIVNGIVENVYRMKEGAGHLSREEFAAISPEDHQRFFAIFLGSLASTVNRYFDEEQVDTTKDGMTYFAASLNLSDEQRRNLRVELLELVTRYVTEPSEGARPTQLGVSLTPDLHIQTDQVTQ